MSQAYSKFSSTYSSQIHQDNYCCKEGSKVRFRFTEAPFSICDGLAIKLAQWHPTSSWWPIPELTGLKSSEWESIVYIGAWKRSALTMLPLATTGPQNSYSRESETETTTDSKIVTMLVSRSQCLFRSKVTNFCFMARHLSTAKSG